MSKKEEKIKVYIEDESTCLQYEVTDDVIGFMTFAIKVLAEDLNMSSDELINEIKQGLEYYKDLENANS